MILKIKIGIIFFISIDVLNAQNAKPPDALSSLFGDLLKSAGNLSPSPSSVTKEPSLLHNLVRNVEKQKSEKSKSDQPKGFQDPLSETKPSNDGFNNNEKTELNLPNKDERVSEKGPSGNKENFKPSKGGEGTNDNDKEEEDRERGPSSGGKHGNSHIQKDKVFSHKIEDTKKLPCYITGLFREIIIGVMRLTNATKQNCYDSC